MPRPIALPCLPWPNLPPLPLLPYFLRLSDAQPFSPAQPSPSLKRCPALKGWDGMGWDGMGWLGEGCPKRAENRAGNKGFKGYKEYQGKGLGFLPSPKSQVPTLRAGLAKGFRREIYMRI